MYYFGKAFWVEKKGQQWTLARLENGKRIHIRTLGYKLDRARQLAVSIANGRPLIVKTYGEPS